MRENLIPILDIESTLSKKSEIVFGPFLGELGWEILRWVGFIRYFHKKYPKIRIIISTRSDRRDLYSDITNEIDLFNFEGDYDKYKPNCYKTDPPLEIYMYKRLISGITEKYPRAFIFDPHQYGGNKGVFKIAHMDYGFNETSESSYILDNLIKEKNKSLIPIVISSRNRTDITQRNWGTHNWKTLFDMIENQNKFLVFVAGKSPTYYKSSNRSNFINLEDYENEYLNTSIIGLTISAILKSQFTLGTQTANIILSNLIGTPTLFWGHEIKRHAVLENPKHTLSLGIEDKFYKMSPYLIFDKMNEFSKQLLGK